MRLGIALTLAFVASTLADEPDPPAVVLTGTIDGRGLPMAECDNGVHRIKLTFRLDARGEGTGTLVLDATPNPVDDYGAPITVKADPPARLDCRIKLVGTKRMLAEGAPAPEVEWQLYEVTGPKIVSKLSLARETRSEWSSARFLWATKEGKNRTLVVLNGPPPKVQQQQIPCHPGCFPSGTRINTPSGSKAIEDVRAGDMVTTIGPDGKPGQVKVGAMFMTRNQLVQVSIDGQTLITTATQPLSLADGKLRAAGELKAGDRIHVWATGERTAFAVRSVDHTERPAPVYNLMIDEPVLFVANGFLARSKPPASVVQP